MQGSHTYFMSINRCCNEKIREKLTIKNKQQFKKHNNKTRASKMYDLNLPNRAVSVVVTPLVMIVTTVICFCHK